jgi:hypothetical protein
MKPLNTLRPGPGEPFFDTRVESYARLRSENHSLRRSALEAGIAATSAQKLEKDDAVQERVVELRDLTRKFTVISSGAVMDQLWKNAVRGYESNDLRSSNQALQLLLGLVKDPKGSASSTGGHAMQLAMRSPNELRDQFRELLGGKNIAAVIDATADKVEEATKEGEPPA